MFRCEKCHKNSEHGEKQHKIVVEKRNKSYHYYIVKVRGHYGKTKTVYTETKPDEKDKNKQILKQFNTRGWEIARQITVCERCANV